MADGFYSSEVHGPYDLIAIGDLELVSGKVLSQCELAVATFGELNKARDNAILIPTWYSGSHKVLADAYIGEGRALDPANYFIIVVNQIGGGLSTSPNNYYGKPDDFPEIAICDDVAAQARLLEDHFSIERLALVCGGSMGGQQALALAAKYPQKVSRVAAFAATPVTSGYLKVALSAMLDTLDGSERLSQELLGAHARFWAMLGVSPEFYSGHGYTALGFPSPFDFVRGFLDPYFGAMDPRILRVMARKAMTADLGCATHEARVQRLAAISMPCLLLPINTDALFPLSDVQFYENLIPGARLQTLQSVHGHLALFGADPSFLAQIDGNLSALLAEKAA